jgi:hypothetical protein
MNDIEHTNRQTCSPTGGIKKKRRTQRQRLSPSPETQPTPIDENQLASLDLQESFITTKKNDHASDQTNSITAKPGAGNSNSLPGHQSSRSKLDQQALNLSDSLSGASGDHDQHPSPPSNLSRKKNLSTSDLDPFERKKQAALVKVEAKLEKAQRLHQKAHQSVEQEISDFLRVTTMPNTNNETTSSRSANATFDKRIKTLQDTKKELEKKITNYHLDISRIQAGEIPHNYSSSKDILSNIKSTAVKVASGSLKHRPTNTTDQNINVSTPSSIEQNPFFHHQTEADSHYHSTNSSVIPTTTISTSGGGGNNNHNLVSQNQHTNTFELMHSSLSSSTSNEIGNSQFYIDSSHEYVYDGEKSNRKHEFTALPIEGPIIHDNEKSPSANRRLTEDSTMESIDQISNHSTDDRHPNSISKRHTSTTTEYQQLNTKIDSMQKIVDRYESKINEMQKQLDTFVLINETQYEQNERLNNELTDLIVLHQTEMSSMKTDLKNLEDRLLYKFNDYWNELLEKLDKLDTRTAKVEQTQTHSLETEENTHRIISKLVNILLTVFAIILLLLSTIKNLVQSRVHAMTLLILAIIWITFHYLPPNYFQTPFFKSE